MGDATAAPRDAVEATIREHWGTLLASLTGSLRDLTLAEDALQDAAVAALSHWPESGVPRHPRTWLLHAARNKAIDRIRRVSTHRDKQPQLEWLLAEEQRTRNEAESPHGSDPEQEEPIVDERLALIFTCCHPALARPARIALTLRTLGGLTTTEIARAFLTPETTMAQRLVRAKKKIAAAKIPYRVPPLKDWPERLESVLSVVYFIFNEGYRATSGSRLTRADLCDEAIRLGRILSELAPHEAEVGGLTALMLLHDARRLSRVDEEGRLVPLDEQDRTRWDRKKIEEGDRRLRKALTRGPVGPYQLQAAISAVHGMADSHDATDWAQIVALYQRLHDLNPSPVIRLNEIVARSFAESAGAALIDLESLAEAHATALDRYQPYWAARADLLRRADRSDESLAAYARAIDLTDNDLEREFLGTAQGGGRVDLNPGESTKRSGAGNEIRTRDPQLGKNKTRSRPSAWEADALPTELFRLSRSLTCSFGTDGMVPKVPALADAT